MCVSNPLRTRCRIILLHPLFVKIAKEQLVVSIGSLSQNSKKRAYIVLRKRGHLRFACEFRVWHLVVVSKFCWHILGPFGPDVEMALL
jgi:hypothetical protein